MIDPNGDEISWRTDDMTFPSGGRLDTDDLGGVRQLWVENINFPLEGGPPGVYTFFVENYLVKGDGPDMGTWTINVYEGDELVDTVSGTGWTETGEQSDRFTYTKQER